MKAYNPEVPLLSIHLPKCGGTSLIDVLKEWYGDRLYLHYYNQKENIMPRKVRVKNFFSYKKGVCIHGHFNRDKHYGTEDYYPGIKQIITFLRDPLEIQISLFNYMHRMIREGKWYKDGKTQSITEDIDEFLENSEPYFKSFFPKDLNKQTLPFYFDNYFIFVGIIEHFQNSLDILAEKLGKKKIVITHENQSERLLKASESSIKKFQEKCSFEYTFYNKALMNIRSY